MLVVFPLCRHDTSLPLIHEGIIMEKGNPNYDAIR
jgi:hypothetical protein